MKLNVVDMIYKQMELENGPRERKLRHYPSGIPGKVDGEFHGKCIRSLYYSMTKAETTNPIEPVALFKMEMGNVIHDTINNVMNRALKRVFPGFDEIRDDNSEEPFVWNIDGLEFPMSSRVDKYIVIDDKKILCEWKSTYGFGVKFIQSDGAKPEALLQTECYFNIPDVKFDGCVLMYVARDSGYLYGFYIEKEDPKTTRVYNMNSQVIRTYNIDFNDTVKYLADIEKSINDQQIPERSYNGVVNEKLGKLMQKSDWQCRYCNYRGLCYGVEG